MCNSQGSEGKVRDFRRKVPVDEKIRILLEGLRDEENTTVLYRREGIAPNLFYRWSKKFLLAGLPKLGQGCSQPWTNALGGLIAQRAVGPFPVGVSPPCLDLRSGILQRGKPVLIQVLRGDLPLKTRSLIS